MPSDRRRSRSRSRGRPRSGSGGASGTGTGGGAGTGGAGPSTPATNTSHHRQGSVRRRLLSDHHPTTPAPASQALPSWTTSTPVTPLPPALVRGRAGGRVLEHNDPETPAPGPAHVLSPRFAPSPEISPRIQASVPGAAAAGGSNSSGLQFSPTLTPVLASDTASRSPSVFKSKPGKRSPLAGPLHINTAIGSAAGSSNPTPILAFTPLPPPADQPEFAELLTPAQLRRRRRAPRVAVRTVGGLPVLTGASRLGYTTGDGELYRGATSDPTAVAAPADGPEVDDDAITLSSGSSGSSSWSWGSGLEHGRRATMAVVHRFGEAIGVRRGSTSSSDSSETASSDSSSSNSSNDAMSRIGRFSRALTRTMSRQTNESSPERPRRVYVPRRREFTLYTPPPREERGERSEQLGSAVSLSSLPTNARAFPISDRLETTVDPRTSDRVIITPVLPPVLEAVRQARIAAGVQPAPLPELPAQTRRHGHTHGHHGHGKSKLGASDVPVRRGGSAPAKQRQFALPTVPRPSLPRSQTRVDALKEQAPPVLRPKSASDLLGISGLASGRSASEDNLTSSAGSSTGVTTTPAGISPVSSPPLPATPPSTPKKPRPRAAWWLDVSCPTWKDLRDIGELLGLHPLTLEDVLHQDPREKIDMYDKLGYYFIVVRALDEQYFKYTPGSTGPPGAELAAAAVGLPSGANANNHGNGASNTTADPAAHAAKRKERTRRGWGFGRATGKAASKVGEKVEIVEDNPGKEGLEGVGVGGVNLYLVVFADGIVSFHYGDVSKHTRRVLERCLLSRDDEATADWVSHGLLDSIIDAFFPLMGYVDGAVDDMDSLTIDPRTDPRMAAPAHVNLSSGLNTSDTMSDFQKVLSRANGAVEVVVGHSKSSGSLDKGGAEWIELDTVPPPAASGITGLHLRQRGAKAGRAIRKRKQSFSRNIRREYTVTPHPTRRHELWNLWTRWMVVFLYLKLFFLPVTDARPRLGQNSVEPDKVVFDRHTMLRSITNMRRLVTGLSRLLGGKHAVVASLLKRAHEANNHNGGDDEAYLSDVHDHILLLQTSLYHYEYILSHCQPAYLSYLNVSSAQSRGGTDVLILALSTVSIGILPMQFVLGLFSMNVRRPQDGITITDPDGKEWEHRIADGTPTGRPAGYDWFAGICVAIFVIACGVVLVVRYWRWLARKKFTQIRGGELPSTWDGFWGWE